MLISDNSRTRDFCFNHDTDANAFADAVGSATALLVFSCERAMSQKLTSRTAAIRCPYIISITLLTQTLLKPLIHATPPESLGIHPLF